MKMKILMPRCRAGTEVSSVPWVWLSLFLLLFLACPVTTVAAPVVSTLTGGPSQANHNYFGYADGNTKDDAQFHTPIGMAFDNSGNFMAIADRDNNAIRILDLAGNLTATFDISDTNLLNKPVGVAADVFNDVFVLNR